MWRGPEDAFLPCPPEVKVRDTEPHPRNTAPVLLPSCLFGALRLSAYSSCTSGPQGDGSGSSSTAPPKLIKTLGGLGPLGLLSLLLCTAAASAGLWHLSNASLRGCRGLGYGEAEAAEVMGEWTRGAYGFLAAAEDLSPNIGEYASSADLVSRSSGSRRGSQ